VVNPLLVKRFIEVDRVRNKTDQGDAKCLARFCQLTQPELWEAPSLGVRTLQALVLRLDTLQEMRQGELNRLDVAHASVQQSMRDVISDLEHGIEAVRKQIQRAIDDDPDLKQRQSLLASIPALGTKPFPNC
jgi:transposase